MHAQWLSELGIRKRRAQAPSCTHAAYRQHDELEGTAHAAHPNTCCTWGTQAWKKELSGPSSFVSRTLLGLLPCSCDRYHTQGHPGQLLSACTLELQAECTMLEQQHSLLSELALLCLPSFSSLQAGCLQVADLIFQQNLIEGALLQQVTQCLTRLCCCMWLLVT